MHFHAEFFPKAFAEKIKHTDKLLLAGSCFTEQIGNKLAAHKFTVLENPNGILFNPASIAKAISSYAAGKLYTEDELFYHNELWGSWEHNTKFSNIRKEDALAQINSSQTAANHFIRSADWILLTLGSAFVYERKEADSNKDYADVAANCHKIPTDKFNRRLLAPDEISTLLLKMMEDVHKVNPHAKFIFTISPVRHLREGFIENNRSKAALIQAVHSIVNENVLYFPAYELVIDDLRDYRFFAEDMAHPNYAATNYVWEKFVPVAIDEPSQMLMKEINEINAAKSHRAFNPASQAHQKFLLSNLEKVRSLSRKFPYIDFSKEEAFFSSPQ